ncbi:MAG: YbhB/YbcL family Raf kinase inhibitor-like protein [Candidatus Liptonbacteria bacterium]|nr:YbhB/YbcL family Raf kinase inhibitor-like protein [Candidatus Liptonbacteria bacterium]
MEIQSPAFGDSGRINDKYTCAGQNLNPELKFLNTPEETKSFALIVDDPDASRGITFNHWLIWNIPAGTKVIPEGRSPERAVQGKNDGGGYGYMGPCPPVGKPHHYRFKLYALNDMLSINKDASLSELENEIKLHLLAEAQLVGIFERK